MTIHSQQYINVNTVIKNITNWVPSENEIWVHVIISVQFLPRCISQMSLNKNETTMMIVEAVDDEPL
jgi:2-phosphoglycerate kinase